MAHSSRHRRVSSFPPALLFTGVLLFGLAAFFLFSHTAVAPAPNASTDNNQPSTINNQLSTVNSPPANAAGEGTANTPDNASGGPEMQSYHSDTFNFTILYPADWQAQQSSSGTGDAQVTNFTFGNEDEGVTMTVMPSALQGIIRESFSLINERPVTIDGVAATRAQGTSAKDGSAVDLLFLTQSGKLFFLNGKAGLVDLVGPTLQFTK